MEEMETFMRSLFEGFRTDILNYFSISGNYKHCQTNQYVQRKMNDIKFVIQDVFSLFPVASKFVNVFVISGAPHQTQLYDSYNMKNHTIST
jgi:hypothetical protein